MIVNSRKISGVPALAWLASIVGIVAMVTQAPEPIQAQGAPVARPLNIVVLADGFTAGEEIDFNEAVANFFTYGLLADEDYKSHANVISVTPIFNAVATSGASQFGFTLGTGITNCSVGWVPDDQPSSTTSRVVAAA